MGLVVISNKPVKKGIEIPEISAEVANDGLSITFQAIDKVKYADFLALGIKVFGTFNTEGVFTYNIADYTGDELILETDSINEFNGIWGISYSLNER